MKFEDEYWVLTEQDAINYAKTLVVSSECEHQLNPNKPYYNYEYCFKHAKKQLDRNSKLNEKQLKLLTLRKMILKQRQRFYDDPMIKSCFSNIENWYHHLGKIRLNKIFLKENQHQIDKVLGMNK